MTHLDLTLPTPAENLALDEALLDSAESTGKGEVLRFWSPNEYFVVVGYANKIELEVNLPACEAINVPILRRCSGGGTVLQGAGCLNYTLILKIENSPRLATVPQTNDFVMERQATALRTVAGNQVSIRGHTDLAIADVKFSGNAQRRKRDFIIFHGTFLLDFDLDLIEKLLRMPSKEPDYRSHRPHRSFLRNLGVAADDVKSALIKAWDASTPMGTVPDYKTLAEQKYTRPDWNFKF